jgi:hypothetical protein
LTTSVRILGIQGKGGLRMDFVAGWLGMLPGFVESHWYIDPVTRQSRGSTANVVDLRQEFDLIEILRHDYRYALSSLGDYCFATKLHGINACYRPLVDNGCISIYNIEADQNVDLSQVKWEYNIKTYGKYEYGSWHIDSLIELDNVSDSDRIAKLDLLLNNPVHVPQKGITQTVYPNMYYSSLFVPGGSEYLCNTVGIDVSRDFHKFWDSMLPLAETPAEVTLWGKRWRKHDYFN